MVLREERCRVQKNPQLEQILERLVGKLYERGDVCTIVLFGSYATGQAQEESDVDVLVVTEREWEDGIEVSHQLVNGWTVELTFIGKETFKADAQEGQPFALSVLGHGKVLLDDGTWAQVRSGCAK